MPSESGDPTGARHWAARLEDTWHAWRERRGRRRGLVPTVIPFVGYGTPERVRVLGRVVLRKPGATPSDRLTNIRGFRSFLSIPVSSARVEVTAGDQRLTIESDRGGVIDESIDVHLEPGWASVRIGIGGDEVDAPVFILRDPSGFGVVSDVDDTVMVTALPRPLLAAWNTFVLDEHARSPVAGMSVLYTRLLDAHPGAPIIYLSTGAWNVAPTLTRFFARNLYPRGALLLTDWGPTHDRWFRSGPEHKSRELERLAAEFPEMTWLLVGDDGQHDERIYGDFVAAHPENVTAVAIRRLTPSEAVLAGGRSAPDPHAEDRGSLGLRGGRRGTHGEVAGPRSAAGPRGVTSIVDPPERGLIGWQASRRVLLMVDTPEPPTSPPPPAALSPLKASPMPAADSGLLAAIMLAGGVTVVVAIAMTIVSQHRAARLTASRGFLSVTLGLSVMALVGLGIAAVSPTPAQAVVVSSVTSTTSSGSATSSGSSGSVDLQLPTR